MASPHRLIEVFHEAKAISAGAEREQFLAIACQDDPLLKEHVVSLLEAHEGAGDFLKYTQPAPAVSLLTEKPGDRIGNYKLLEQIGEGGFGVVWVAEQERPVRRRVALKIIKLGMDTKEVIARFEQERQALAMMDHPNIAKVFEASATPSGRPFFVMELVRGIKITEYCDQANLATTDRLQLFMAVCQAVQHAHQKGIIHRDLKPSNILVTLHDGTPVPKVIDFGVAKATQQQRLTDLTVYTQFEQMIGTPVYMSPEQAEMSGLDIDTRSDIYSLGVLLYELLTGRTPFDPEELMRHGVDEIRRTIREDEPKKPSTFVQTMALELRTSVAHHRHSDAAKLVGLIRGDLDWIVMKALEKDRTRRYDTATGLAVDLKRHLNNEPVSARSPSALYRFQKLARRNKLAFVAGSAIALALIFGLVGSTWQAMRARKAEQVAMLERGRAQKQAQLAAQEAARAAAVATAARRYAYAAEINVALQALAEHNLGRARELLDRQQPKAGEEDLRGFEWRYLWQLCQGDEFATFRDESPHATAFSPDGKLFAYSGGKIIVRETASRKVVATLDSPATTLSFAPGAKLLASGHDSGVKLWDTETWQEVRSLPKTMHPARFSPDGRWLLTGVAEGFQVWDTAAWQSMGICPGTSPLTRWQTRNAVAFSPDSQFLVTIASEGSPLRDYLRAWRLPGLEELPPLRFEGESPGSAAFLLDGKHLVAGLWDGRVVVWDFATRKVLAMRKEHTGWVTAVAVAPDGKTFATSSADRTVNLWDAVTFEHLVRLRGHVGEVWSAAFSPDSRALVSGSPDGTTKLWNAELRHTQMTLDGFNIVIGFTSGGHSLIAGTSNSVCAWTPEGGGRVDFPFPTSPPLVPGTQPYHLNPNEPLLALGRADGTLEVWHLTTGAMVTEWSAHSHGVSAVAFSSDGQRLATASTHGGLKVWDFATRQEVARFAVDCKVLCLAFSHDGKTVAASGHSGNVWVFDLATRLELLRLPDHGNLVASVAFSPDGKLLATASVGNDARLWELPSGKLQATLKGHVQGVLIVAFSPDGKTLVTGGDDRKVKLWNVATHQELATFSLGGLGATLAFSQDGRMLAIGNWHEARIQILRAPSFEEIQAAGKTGAHADD
jgi:WD40 repeat protein/serine/threonine protein kinase